MNDATLAATWFCVCFQLRRSSRAVTQLYDAALQPSGIRSTQFALLVAIARKEPITISELGELLVIDSTTLSRSLRTLEQMGILKVVNGADRRERLVRLTSMGRRVLSKSLPYWRKVQRKVVSRLAEPGWSEIRKTLQNIKSVSQDVFAQTAR